MIRILVNLGFLILGFAKSSKILLRSVLIQTLLDCYSMEDPLPQIKYPTMLMNKWSLS